MTFLKRLTPFTLPFLLAACGDDNLDPNAINAPDMYEFASLTNPSSVSSVDYREATTRLVLIKELEYLIGSDYLQEYGADLNNSKEDVVLLLNRIYEGGSSNLSENNLYGPSTTVTTIKGINFTSDNTPDFSDASLMTNINIKDAVSAKDNVQIQEWFEHIATLAVDQDADTRFISNGFDYQALVNGYLSVVMPFNQVNNIYLATNNLATDNSREISDLPYTQLEHNWDLAFGYFGTLASGQKSSLQNIIISNGSVDNLDSYAFDFAAATAQRDLNSPFRDVTFSQSIMHHFLNGRATISLNEEHNYFPEQNTLINNHAEKILYNWERALAATLIYHIENMINNRYITDQYDYHWAMMNSYTQAIASNENSLISAELIATLTNNKAAFPQDSDEIRKQTTYLEGLYYAEQSLITSYDFTETNVNAWH